MHRLVLLLVALLGAACGSSSEVAVAPPSSFELTILHNNDGGSALLPTGDVGGIARFATVVREARAKTSGQVLLLSAGGNLGANPEFRASLEKGVPFYDTQAMQLLGYDASGVGDAEFFFGPEVFAQFQDGLGFVSANLAGARVVRSLTLQGVGVVGVTRSDLAEVSTPGPVVASSPVAAAAQAEIDRLTSQGVKVVVVLSALGGLEPARALARQLRDADVVVADSDDQVLANSGNLLLAGDTANGPYPLVENGVPVVLTGGGYRYLGRLAMRFSAEGRLLEVEPSSGPLPVVGVSPDPALLAQVELPVQQAVARAAAVVVATTEVALDGRASALRVGETNLGDLVADSLLAQGTGRRVAFVNSGALRQNRVLPVGPITGLDLQEIAPFASLVVRVPGVSATLLKALMENSVAAVESPDPRFAQIAGFRLTFDPARPVGQRVLALTLDDGTALVRDGQVVTGVAPLEVVTLDFVARGGDDYPFEGAPYVSLGLTYQDALARHVRSLGVVREPAAGRIVRL